MNFPFNRTDFLEVFREYNLGIWPVLLPLLFAGMIGVMAIWEAWPQRDRIVGAVLAGLWLWAGAVYHWGYFAHLTPAAIGFGALFVGQALGLGYYSSTGRLTFQRPTAFSRRWLGVVIVVYALAGYPALAIGSGHVWPRIPTFGAPCPMAIYTFGLLLCTTDTFPRRLLIVPLLWTAVATSAALKLGMREDWGLPIAALLALGVLRPWQSRSGSDFRPANNSPMSHPV